MRVAEVIEGLVERIVLEDRTGSGMDQCSAFQGRRQFLMSVVADRDQQVIGG